MDGKYSIPASCNHSVKYGDANRGYAYAILVFRSFLVMHILCFYLVASPDYGMEGSNIVIAVLIPAAVVLLVILGIYLYFAK